MAQHKEATTPNTRRQLADFPQWAEAEETLRRLRLEEQVIVAQYRKADGALHEQTQQESRIGKLANTILAKVGATRPAEVTSEAELVGAELAEKRLACENALEQHERKMTSLRIQLSTEVYKSWEQEHLAARQKIAKALVELATAVQDEGQLAEKMAAAGALTSARWGGRLWVNTSTCPLVPAVFRALNVGEFCRNNANLLKQ